MADPVSLLHSLLQAVRSIKQQHDNNLQNHAECALLVGRVAALEPSLTCLLERPTSVTVQALRNLQDVIEDIRAALDTFRETTYWRRADRVAHATRYLQQFAGLQARLAAVAGDLSLAATATLSGDVARLLDLALRCEDDLAEARRWMEGLVSARLGEMEAEKEADARAFALLREEVQRGHEGLLAAVQVISATLSGQGLAIPTDLEAAVHAVLTGALSHAESGRPSFEDIQARLHRIASSEAVAGHAVPPPPPSAAPKPVESFYSDGGKRSDPAFLALFFDNHNTYRYM